MKWHIVPPHQKCIVIPWSFLTLWLRPLIYGMLNYTCQMGSTMALSVLSDGCHMSHPVLAKLVCQCCPLTSSLSHEVLQDQRLSPLVSWHPWYGHYAALSILPRELCRWQCGSKGSLVSGVHTHSAVEGNVSGTLQATVTDSVAGPTKERQRDKRIPQGPAFNSFLSFPLTLVLLTSYAALPSQALISMHVSTFSLFSWLFPPFLSPFTSSSFLPSSPPSLFIPSLLWFNSQSSLKCVTIIH